MSRFTAVALVPWVFAAAVFVSAQTSTSNNPVSDPQALALASKSMLALTGGAPITDVTLAANVTSIPDHQAGTATLEAKGPSESRVDLNTSESSRSEVRSTSNGFPAGSWANNGSNPQSLAMHNCWTDAAWFFPALSRLSQTANPSYMFSYLGQETHNGLAVEHLRVVQLPPGALKNAPTARLSATDFFLDPSSLLPMAIAFNVHPDHDMGRDIPVEIRLANYQAINGVQVPYHIQRLMNGGLALDFTVTHATLNAGLADSLFSLQ